MACLCGNTITEGISVLCDNNAGGVLAIYVTDKCNVISSTETVEGVVDAVVMETNSQFYKIETQRLTASLEENESNNFDNGSKFWAQILNLVIARRDVARRNAIRSYGAGQKDLCFIVEDSNGILWFAGREEGMKLFTDTSGTGTKKEDLNGFTIQFTGQASDMMPTLDASLLPALIVPAV